MNLHTQVSSATQISALLLAGRRWDTWSVSKSIQETLPCDGRLRVWNLAQAISDCRKQWSRGCYTDQLHGCIRRAGYDGVNQSSYQSVPLAPKLKNPPQKRQDEKTVGNEYLCFFCCQAVCVLLQTVVCFCLCFRSLQWRKTWRAWRRRINRSKRGMRPCSWSYLAWVRPWSAAWPTSTCPPWWVYTICLFFFF